MERLKFVLTGALVLWCVVVTGWWQESETLLRAANAKVHQLNTMTLQLNEHLAVANREKIRWRVEAEKLSQIEGKNDEIENPYLRAAFDSMRRP